MSTIRMCLLAVGLGLIAAGCGPSAEQSGGKAPADPAARTILDLAAHSTSSFTWSQEHADILRDLALEQAAAGDSDGARKNLAYLQELKKTSAKEATKDLADRRLRRNLQAIAMVQMRLGAPDDAQQTIQMDFPDRTRIEDTFRELATAQARHGDPQGGLEFASFITTKSAPREDAIAGVVRESRGGPGVVRQALEIGSLPIPHFVTRFLNIVTGNKLRIDVQLIQKVAAAQAEGGDAAGALQTASTLESDDRDNALGMIAGARVKHGDLVGAVQTLSSIGKNRSLRGGSIVAEEIEQMIIRKDVSLLRATTVAGDIGQPMPTVADIAAAIQLAETLPDTSRVRLWPALALLSGREGRIEEVRGLHARFLKLDPVLMQAQAFPGVISFGRALAMAGAVQDALQIVNDFRQEALQQRGDERLAAVLRAAQTHVLQTVLAAQVRSGDLPGALGTADSIWGLPSENNQAARDHALSSAVARVRDDEQLHRAIRKFFPDSARHDEILGLTARVRANNGDFEPALGTAALIRAPFSKDLALSDIAAAQARAGRVQDALRTLQAIQTPSVKEQTLTPVALAQAKNGDGQGASRTLALQPALLLRVEATKAWQDIAFIQTESGDGRGALAWIADLQDKTARARALVGVAAGLRAGSRAVPPDALARLAEKWKKEEAELAAITDRARAADEADKHLFEPPPCETSGQASAQAGPASLTRATQLTQEAAALNAKGSRAAALKAIPLAQEAVEIRRRALGDQHPDVAESLTVLGHAYLVWGGIQVGNMPVGAVAKSVLECALGIQEKTMGGDHLDVAQTLHFLGRLRAMSPDRGKPLFERALAIRMKHLGPNHPLTLESQLAIQADPAQIEPLLRKVLANRERALGAGHPDVEQARNALLSLSLRKGNAQEAGQLMDQQATLQETRYVNGEDDDPMTESKVILSRIRRMAASGTANNPERLGQVFKDLPRPPRYSYWQIVNGAFVPIQGGARDTTPCDVTQPPSPWNLAGIVRGGTARTLPIAAAKGNFDIDATCDEWNIYEDGWLNHTMDDR